MSAETESIILGFIALFAAIGTAVAIRRKTAPMAVACCVVIGGALLLFGGLDREARRDAEREAQRLQLQKQLRASYSDGLSNESSTDAVRSSSGADGRSSTVIFDLDGRRLDPRGIGGPQRARTTGGLETGVGSGSIVPEGKSRSLANGASNADRQTEADDDDADDSRRTSAAAWNWKSSNYSPRHPVSRLLRFSSSTKERGGAIRAAKQCTSCHECQRGELLGAFSYRFERP